MTTSSALCVSNDRFPMPEKSLVIFLHGTGASGAQAHATGVVTSFAGLPGHRPVLSVYEVICQPLPESEDSKRLTPAGGIQKLRSDIRQDFLGTFRIADFCQSPSTPSIAPWCNSSDVLPTEIRANTLV